MDSVALGDAFKRMLDKLERRMMHGQDVTPQALRAARLAVAETLVEVIDEQRSSAEAAPGICVPVAGTEAGNRVDGRESGPRVGPSPPLEP